MTQLRYELMRYASYAKGMHALRNSYQGKEAEIPQQLLYTTTAGETIVRAQTIGEIVKVRVEDFNRLTETNTDGSIHKRTIEERLRLFKNTTYSCTGLLMPKNNGPMSLIEECEELITIAEDHKGDYITIDSKTMKNKGIPLPLGKNIYYNEPLTQEQALIAEPWIVLVGDKRLFEEYVNIVFENKITSTGGVAMAFWLLGDRGIQSRETRLEDRLCPLMLGSHYSSSSLQSRVLTNLDNFIRPKVIE